MSRTVSHEFKKPVLYRCLSAPLWVEPTPASSFTAAPLTAVVGSALGKWRSGAVISNLLPGQEAGSGLQTGCGKSQAKGKITIN